jgi:hypothetical protein
VWIDWALIYARQAFDETQTETASSLRVSSSTSEGCISALGFAIQEPTVNRNIIISRTRSLNFGKSPSAIRPILSRQAWIIKMLKDHATH